MVAGRGGPAGSAGARLAGRGRLGGRRSRTASQTTSMAPPRRGLRRSSRASPTAWRSDAPWRAVVVKPGLVDTPMTSGIAERRPAVGGARGDRGDRAQGGRSRRTRCLRAGRFWRFIILIIRTCRRAIFHKARIYEKNRHHRRGGAGRPEPDRRASSARGMHDRRHRQALRQHRAPARAAPRHRR